MAAVAKGLLRMIIQNPLHPICSMLETGIKILLASHVFLDLTPIPPPIFFPHILSNTNQLWGWILARPRQRAHPLPSSSLFCSLLRWMAMLAGHPCVALASPLLIRCWCEAALMLSQGSASPFYMLPKSCQFLLPTRGPGLAVPSLLMGRRGVEGSPSLPPQKRYICPGREGGMWCGCWSWTLHTNMEEDKGTGWPSSWVGRPWGHARWCTFSSSLQISLSWYKAAPQRVFLSVLSVPVWETRSTRVRGGGGHEGCAGTAHDRLLIADHPFTCQELSLEKAAPAF